jgi:hypothetical protein
LLPRDKRQSALRREATPRLFEFAPCTPTASIDNKRLNKGALADRPFERVDVRWSAAGRRDDASVLPNELVAKILLNFVFGREVVPSRAVLRFDDDQCSSDSQDDIRLRECEARPKPTLMECRPIIPSVFRPKSEPSRQEIPGLNPHQRAEHSGCECVLEPLGFGNRFVQLSVEQCLEHWRQRIPTQ